MVWIFLGASTFAKMPSRCDEVIYETAITLSSGAVQICLFNEDGCLEWPCEGSLACCSFSQECSGASRI